MRLHCMQVSGRCTTAFSLLAVALSFPAPPSPAQTPPTLTKGAHVRVTWPSASDAPSRQVVGTLERLATDTIVVARGYLPPDTATLTATTRLELDIAHGHGPAGAIVGALLGLAAASGVWQSCGDCSGGLPLVLAVPGAALGGGLGWGVGSMIRRPHWVSVQPVGMRIGSTSTGPSPAGPF